MNPNPSPSQQKVRDYKTIPPQLKNNPFDCEVWRRNRREGFDIKIAICADSKAGSQTRVGKSSLALVKGQSYDIDNHGVSRFSVDNVVFDWPEFKEFLSERHPRGTVLMCEEAQVWLNSRNFNSKENKDIMAKLSTGGVFGYIFIFTYPQFETIDSQVRPLIHYELRVTKKDMKNKLIHYVPYTCYPGFRIRDDIYREPFMLQNGFNRSVFHGRCPLPSRELMDKYEEKALGYKKDIQDTRIRGGETIADKMESIVDARRSKEELLVNTIANELWPIRHTLASSRSRYSTSMICAKTGYGSSRALAIKLKLEEMELLNDITINRDNEINQQDAR